MRAGFVVLLSLGITLPLRASAAPRSASLELSDEQFIAKLVDALDDPDSEVRMNLGVALAQFGVKAVGPLIDAMERGTPNQRAGAAYALSQLRATAKPALPVLLKALKAPEDMVRRNASYALSRILPEATVAAQPPKSTQIMPPLDPTPGDTPSGGPK
jgi:HEAT repeat protein